MTATTTRPGIDTFALTGNTPRRRYPSVAAHGGGRSKACRMPTHSGCSDELITLQAFGREIPDA
jgi:hypothetical protein